MLGLAASHLGLCSDGDYSTQALSHRVTAISSLNKSLGRPCSSKAEGDARFAAMMALTFQASYMADGVIDFLCMSRGCHIVAMTAMPKFDDSLFRSFSHDGHINTVKAMLETASNDPTHQQDMIDSFLDSLRAIMPLCGSTLELKFLTMTDAILRQARTAPVDGEQTSSQHLPCLHPKLARDPTMIVYTDRSPYSVCKHGLIIRITRGGEQRGLCCLH